MELNLGPIRLACVSGRNWTYLEAGIVTNRGAARRETAISAGFKSEHLLEATGKDNKADVYTCPDTGKEYYGKIVQAAGGGAHLLTAKEVYTKALYDTAVKTGLKAVDDTTEPEPITVQAAEPAAVAA